MFSFQQTDELVFHHNMNIPSSVSIFQQQATNQQHDLIAVDLLDHVTKSRKLHRDQLPSGKPNSASNDNRGVVEESTRDEHTHRKILHREIERQRRRDMAKLYASLRGLLPVEFLKGKRSTSDHMHEAVNYIKHMEEKIRVLNVKRDKLKNFLNTGVPRTEANTNEKSITNLVPNTVSVSSCNEGILILINSCSIEDGFPLSKVLKEISLGFNVITCSCTKVNQRLIHSIQIEVNDQLSSDSFKLQEKLVAIANNY